MILKLFFMFALLLSETTDAGIQKSEKRVSFSIEKIWQSYKKTDKCCICESGDDPEWLEGVQQFYNGCKKASWNFRGQSYHLADIVMKAIEDYLVKLIYFSNSNSTVLTSSSTALLKPLSRNNKLGGTSLNIIVEYEKVFPDMIEEFTKVVTKLENVIGPLTCSFNKAVVDLGDVFSKYMKEFVKNSKKPTKNRKKINYEPVFKQCQKLMNFVALIAETLLNECELATRAVHEAVTVLSLIFYYLAFAVQGINSCVQDFLFEEKCAVSPQIKSLSEAMEYLVVEVNQAISAVVFPFTKSIEELLTILVNITMAFNTAVKDIFGVFEGVSITVEEIAHILTKSVKEAMTKKTNIVKGIAPK